MLWAPGVVSAVDTAEIAQGQDVGVTEVVVRRVAGRTLTFEPAADNRFRDRETGTIWDIHGEALSGPFAGEALERLVHHDVFWFVWSAFKDEGDLYEAEK